MKGVNFQHSGKRSVIATELTLPGRNSKFVGANGEINASNKKDLMAAIAAAIELSSSGTSIITEETASNAELYAKHRQMVAAAFSDEEFHRELGQEMANDLYVSANKEGFMRRFLKKQELSQGQIPTVQLRMKNVTAVIASAASRVETQYIRDNTHYPPEFYITARPYIEKREIDRTNTDILEEKYIESLEAIMVGEDLTWKYMADAAQGIANEPTTIVGTLTPTALANLVVQVQRWRIPATNCLLATDLWPDIIGDTGWSGVIDPVSKHELLLNGTIGRALGMTMLTDAFRHQTQHILNAGDIYIVGAPENHGQYTDRGGIESQPIDGTNENIPGRGWFMSETVSMIIANARSVAYGRRV